MNNAQYYHFPGDTGLDYSALWRSHVGWLASAVYASAFARGCRINVSPGTQERWFRFGAYAYLLDKLIDDQPVDMPDQRREACQIYEQLVQGQELRVSEVPDWVNPDLLSVAALFNSATRELEMDVTVRKRALGFLAFADRKAAEQSAWRYSRLVAREGRLMARLMVDLMTPSEQQSRRLRRFRRWFGLFAAGGALLDSTRDLTSDYRDNRSGVTPTKAHRLLVLGWCLLTSAILLVRPRLFGVLVWDFSKFWGMPFKLAASWGEPAAEWKACAANARAVRSLPV